MSDSSKKARAPRKAVYLKRMRVVGVTSGILVFCILAACDGSDSGGKGATGGSAGTGSGGVSGSSAGGSSGASDAGDDADGAGAVGSGGTTGDSGAVCGGPDFASCLVLESDGYGACYEGSGFPDATQKALFDQTCADGGGTLGTEPCSHMYPNVGGCTLPASFCYVVWNLNPDDPSTPEDEFEQGKTDRAAGCALTGGTYYPP